MNLRNFDNVVVLDFGGRNNQAYMTINGKKSEKLSHEEVLNLDERLLSGTLLVAEKAHLGVPKEKSLAQLFNSKELLDFYDRLKHAGIELRLFPEKHTPTALARYCEKHPGTLKSDKVDPIVIYEFIIDPQTRITLEKPPTFFDSKKEVAKRLINESPANIREEYWILKKKVNETLNVARKRKYLDDTNTQFIVDHASRIRDYLLGVVDQDGNKKYSSDLIDKICGFDFYKKEADRIKRSALNMTLLYTILSTLRDHEGNLHIREKTKDLPSVNHAFRYIICSSPSHMKGGIARSNIFWHGFRNYLRSITKDKSEVDFKRKVQIVQADAKKDLIVGQGNFTDKERDIFRKERIKYMGVLKDIYRAIKELLST